MLEIKHITWKSSAGYDQERWEILRDGFGLGTISQCGYSPNWSNSLKYQAVLANSYRPKYFVKFDSAVKWIERKMESIRPISELNTLLERG